jgi:hypothetical protein
MNRLPKISIKLDSTHQTYFCLSLLVVSVVAYLYFLNVSVVHVVMRKEATQEQNRLRTEIAMLETSYIESQHKIADKIADLEGYSTETDKIFITRGQTGLVLRDN